MNRADRSLRGGLAVTLVLLSVACAQTPRQKPPAQLQLAERNNLLGMAAESRQKFAAAEIEFMEAYRRYSAVENYRGMVTALVNSSRLYRRQGNLAGTEAVLKQAEQLVPQAPELEAEVSFEMAKLALAKGEPVLAVNWAERAVQSAVAADRGRMLNLQAIACLQLSELPRARDLALAALKASRGVADRREEANALRLLGDIDYAAKLYPESREMYQAALPLDKELALSVRISDDLRGIARSLAATGELEAAAAYFQRSFAINMAERELGRGVKDLESLRELYERAKNGERLAETVKLLEKMKKTGSTQEQ